MNQYFCSESHNLRGTGVALEAELDAPFHRRPARGRPSVMRESRRWEPFIALGCYLSISVVYLGLQKIARLSAVAMPKGDSLQFMWFLNWWPYAVTHGLNPFLTKFMFSPLDFNLAWATSVPAIAVLAAPVTRAVGPIVAFNVVMLAAPSLAALSAFLLCRYLTKAFAPAFIGGLLFGFSSYEVAQFSAGHLNLVFTCWLPLAVLLCILVYDRRLGPALFVVSFALIVALQLGTSAELLATATAFGGVALAAAFVVNSERRGDILRLARCLGIAFVIAGLIVLPYVYYTYIGLHDVPPALWDPEDFSVDLANYVVPTTLTWFGGSLFAPLSARFTGNLGEQGAYLGLPVLCLAAAAAIMARRSVGGKILIMSGIVVVVASLGPALHLMGHVHGARVSRLPWALIGRLPFLRYALPARTVVHVTLIVSLAVALWLSNASASRRVKSILAFVSVVFLVPAIGSPQFQAKIDIPPFFANHTYRQYLRPGDTALLVPCNDVGKGLLWQAMSDMYFRWACGYAVFYPPDPGLGNTRPIGPGRDIEDWPLLASLLQSGTPYPGYGPMLQQFVAAHQVRFVIAEGVDRSRWQAFLGPVLGPGVEVGGITLYRVSQLKKW